MMKNETMLEISAIDDSGIAPRNVTFHVDFSDCPMDVTIPLMRVYTCVMSGICYPAPLPITVAGIKNVLDSYTPNTFVTNPAYALLFTISFEDETRYKIEKAESNDDGNSCYVVTKVNTVHFVDTFNLNILPYEVDFSKTKNRPENLHKAFLNFVDQIFGGDGEDLESFIKNQGSMKKMLHRLSTYFNNEIPIGDITEQEHHCFCITLDDGQEFNIIKRPDGYYYREIYSGPPVMKNSDPNIETSTKVSITRLDDLPLPYIVDFSENEKIDSGWSEKELECLFKENMRDLHDRMYEGTTICRTPVWHSSYYIKQFLCFASEYHKKQVKRVSGQHLFKVVFNDVTYAITDIGKVHAYCRVTEHKTQLTNTSNPQETTMSKPFPPEPSNAESVDARLQKLEDAFKRDIAAIADDQIKTERKLHALEKDYDNQTKQNNYLSKQLNSVNLYTAQLESRINAIRQHLKERDPQFNNVWPNNPNNAFGHPPQNFGFSEWHNPVNSPRMPRPHSSMPPGWSPFAKPNQYQAPPVLTIKPGDLPPYPGAVVKPEDLSICNGVVTCCIGPNGELYRLTKDTIIAHIAPWSEKWSRNLKSGGGRPDEWSCVMESVPGCVPAGTLIHTKSNHNGGLIVRYPDSKYDFKIVNL